MSRGIGLDLVVMGRLARRHRMEWLSMVILCAVSTVFFGGLGTVRAIIPGLARSTGVPDAADAVNLPSALIAGTVMLAAAPISTMCFEAQRESLSRLAMIGASRTRLAFILLGQVSLAAGSGAVMGAVFCGLVRRPAVVVATSQLAGLRVGDLALPWAPLASAGGLVVGLVLVAGARGAWVVSGPARPVRRRRSAVGRAVVSLVLMAGIGLLLHGLLSLRPISRADDSAVGSLVMMTMVSSILTQATVALWGRSVYPRLCSTVARLVWSTGHACAGAGLRSSQRSLLRFPATCTALSMGTVVPATLFGTFSTISSGLGQRQAINYSGLGVLLGPVVCITFTAAACHVVMSGEGRAAVVRSERLVGGGLRHILTQLGVELAGLGATVLLVVSGIVIPHLWLLSLATGRVLNRPCPVDIPYLWLLGVTAVGVTFAAVPASFTTLRGLTRSNLWRPAHPLT